MKKVVALVALMLIPATLAQEHPIFGSLESMNMPLALLGAFLGLVDGTLNPCALSILFFLAAYMIGLGSRKKLLAVGLTYSLIVFTVYCLFVYLLTQSIFIVSSYIGYVQVMRYILASILFILGAIEIKDFFFYGKWISLGIPKFAKPHIEKLTKASTIPATILLGLLVSLVEIPCAGGFPFAYAAILSKSLNGVALLAYSMLYTTFFVIPLIILTLIFYFGFVKVEDAEKKRKELRRYMRLIAGLILILFGIAFMSGWL